MKEQGGTQRKRGFMLAFLAGLLWGASSPVAQYLFEQKDIVSEWLVPYRLLCAGILLFVYAVVWKQQEPWGVWKEKKDGIRQVLFSILGMMGMQYTFFAMVQETNAGTATIFQYLNPAVLILYYALLYRVPPKAKEILAVFCSVSGIFLVATHGNIHAMSVSGKGLFDRSVGGTDNLLLRGASSASFEKVSGRNGVCMGHDTRRCGFDTGNQTVADCSVYRSWRCDCIFGDCDSGYDCAVLFLSGSSGEGGIGVYRTFVQCRACGGDSVCILVPGNEVSAHRSGWICAGIVNYVYFELQIHIIKNRKRMKIFGAIGRNCAIIGVLINSAC